MTRSFRILGLAVSLALGGACQSGLPAASPPSPSVAISSVAPSALPSPTTPKPSVAPSLHPEIAALTGRIVFARAGHGFGDESLFVMNADGTGERRLTEPDVACCAKWSPDGSQLMVMLSEQPSEPITGGILALDGSAPVRLTLSDPSLNLVPQAWFPDGKRIVFEGWDDGDPSRTGAYSAAVDGSDLHRITTAPAGVHDIPADVSPDGSKILFYRGVIGGQSEVYDGLWLADLQTGATHEVVVPGVRLSWWASWSPDGSRILVSQMRNEPDGAIWTTDGDGRNPQRIYVDPGGGFPVTPGWSPDGDRIVFALDPITDEYRHPINTLFVMDADGTNVLPLLGGENAKRRPDWTAAP